MVGEPELEFCVLGSGSAGNAILVRGGGTSLLIDAGFSVRETRRRLAAAGLEDLRPDALLITHEHADHVQHARALSRAFDVPVYVGDGTRKAWPARLLKGDEAFERLEPGRPFSIGRLEIESWVKRHDASEPLSLLVSFGGRSFGCLTDLGAVSESDLEAIRRSDLLFLEANHDPAMLARGPYPPALRRRVGGREGHLSNDDAAKALGQAAVDRLRTVVLGHLSMRNNALERVREAFVRHGGQGPGYERWISFQDRPTRRFRLAAEL